MKNLKALLANVIAVKSGSHAHLEKMAPIEPHYEYDIRHGDSDFDLPRTIEPRVMVNFWGRIYLRKPLTFDNPRDPHIGLTAEQGDTIRAMEEEIDERNCSHRYSGGKCEYCGQPEAI